jgi:hypothetical protein
MTASFRLGNPTAIDADGLLTDVDVQAVGHTLSTREEKQHDVDQFFFPAVTKDVNGKRKRYCVCKLCL